jgi:ribonuclease BN (tRNA processing enzyme)
MDMYDDLVALYQNNNTSRILHMKPQLQIFRMNNEDTILSYCMKITQIRDKIIYIGDTMKNVELVIVALIGLPRF